MRNNYYEHQGKILQTGPPGFQKISHNTSPVSDLDDRLAPTTPGLRLMEVKFSAASLVVGVVGSGPIDRNRLKPLTPVATDGVVAIVNKNQQNCTFQKYNKISLTLS